MNCPGMVGGGCLRFRMRYWLCLEKMRELELDLEGRGRILHLSHGHEEQDERNQW